MAELILTQAETDALSWLDLDDDALGKITRTAMVQILNSAEEQIASSPTLPPSFWSGSQAGSTRMTSIFGWAG